MIKVEYIGGVDEKYMLTHKEYFDERDFHTEHLILSLEDVQSMVFQFKKLLKPIQFKEAVYRVEECYKNET